MPPSLIELLTYGNIKLVEISAEMAKPFSSPLGFAWSHVDRSVMHVVIIQLSFTILV